MQEQDEALGLAAVFDASGGAKEISWDDLGQWHSEQGTLWVHLSLNESRAREWLIERSGLTPAICEALLASETRPRAVSYKDGLLIILRGVNLNPEASPDDMVSIRLWVEAHRVISVRRRRLFAVQDIIGALLVGNGPRTTGDFIVQLADNLTTRAGPVIVELHDQLGAIEEEVHVKRDAAIRNRLSAARRTVIGLRRFIAPQREMLMQLSREHLSWWGVEHQFAIRETAYALTRHLEDLDVAREQAIVTHDELTAYVSERLGRTMYVLALVTTFFLPVTFLTGLLGMNVGGVPGAPPEAHPYAFHQILILMAVILGGQAWLLHRMRLLR